MGKHWILNGKKGKHRIPNRVPIDPAPSYEMSSPNSSEESLTDIGGALKDPYKVTLHYVTNPGQSVRLRKLLEPLIKCFDPSFKLFNIAERSRSNGLQPDTFDISETEYPALGVVLFLLKDDDEEEFDDALIVDNKLDRALDHLCKRPWQNHHHTCLSDNFTLYRQNRQDYYATENDIPFWAVRQVHHGKEHLRFMIYSTHARWDDMVQFYSLLVGRKAEYERDDFCYFLIHSKELMDIQLALKKVPHGCHPRALNSAFLQIKVREIGELVPLLPNACSPISPQRWQTNDPDGNVTLLLVNRKQLGTIMSSSVQQKPRLLLRQQSTDVLQTLLAPKALRPMARLSPRLHLSPVTDDDENSQ
ncbi:protein FAM124A-like [Amphiura filiformis]|uniref:protein FAM124A-like n=1 Tax=Amphiura filiformis TaxID=82378 RepID=UPI003B21C640